MSLVMSFLGNMCLFKLSRLAASLILRNFFDIFECRKLYPALLLNQNGTNFSFYDFKKIIDKISPGA